jgi:hypothetical protein
MRAVERHNRFGRWRRVGLPGPGDADTTTRADRDPCYARSQSPTQEGPPIRAAPP